MGAGALILTALTHPTEAKALITYKVWRDPLRSIEDNPEESGWYVPSSRRAPLSLALISFARVLLDG